MKNINFIRIIPKILRGLQILCLIGFLPFLFALGFKMIEPELVHINIGKNVLFPKVKDLAFLSEDITLSYKNDPVVNASLEITGTNLELSGNYPKYRSFLIVFGIVFLVIWLFALEQVRHLAKGIVTDQPFTRLNMQRIQGLGAVILAVPFIMNFFDYLCSKWVLSNIDFVGLELRQSFGIGKESFSWIICAVFIFLIGKILEVGIKLKEENESII